VSATLLRSGAIVSLMTLVSRILGLVRDIVVANLMGAGAAADVFFFANRIPNFLRRLFAEGAFSQAFVPVLTEYHSQGEAGQVRELIARVSGTLGTLVSVITLVGVVGSPLLAMLFGTGWFVDWLNDGPDGHKFELAAVMLKITFPYLWFITFTALSGAILNTLGQFAVAAFTPVFLNIAIIAAAIGLAPHLPQPEIGLAWGVFAGGLIQFLFQLPFLWRNRVLVAPRWGWSHPGVVKIRRLMLPALFGVSVSQINLLFDTFIASFLMTGSISWLYYSDRLLEFPLGLFGIAIATVILPALSARHVDNSAAEFSRTMDWGVRMICFLGIPATAGMIVLAEPMLKTLFMRGEFCLADVQRAGLSLIAYGSGLLSFMLVKVLAPGYYARQDTRTPVRYGIIAMICNMGFNVLLVFPFGYVGLAMATSASALLNAGLLYRGLMRRGIYRVSRSSWQLIGKLVLAALVMAGLLLWLSPPLSQWVNRSTGQDLAWLGQLIGLGMVVYLATAWLLGVRLGHLKV